MTCVQGVVSLKPGPFCFGTEIHTKKTIINNSNADIITANKKSIASPGIIFILYVVLP